MLRQVAKELSSLQSEPPEGITVVMNEGDLTDIQASIQGPGMLFMKTYFFFNSTNSIEGLGGKMVKSRSSFFFNFCIFYLAWLKKSGEWLSNLQDFDYICDVLHVILGLV